jgi:hypothetical protein
MFKVTVTEISPQLQGEGYDHGIVRFEQTVDAIDMFLIINAVNSPPEKPRQRAQRRDAGKPKVKVSG